jgi:hypothetical protein
MNKSIFILILAASMALYAAPEHVLGQYITVELEIPAEVDADVLQSLDFGTLISNSGTHRVDLGHPDMGIFSLRVLQAQSMLFNLQLPDYLEHSSPDTPARIPISLEAAYTNTGVDDPGLAQLITSPYEEVVMALPDNPGRVWATAFIFLFGEVEVGDVPDGTYRGEIILNVEYE